MKRTDKAAQPSPPFTTSTMQQEASRKLSMTPRRTMAIAQQLYEGVDIEGEGTVGLITYMRTDSPADQWGGPGLRQDLHYGPLRRTLRPDPPLQGQGGRPGRPRGHPPQQRQLDAGAAEKDLTGEQYRLYRLVWSRFLASQMANAVYDSVAVEVEAAGHSFRASSSSLKFSGYTAVYEEGKDEEKEEKESPCPPCGRANL